MTTRVPAHLEVSGFVRQVSAAGGFAAILKKGEKDAGTILLVLAENGGNLRVAERMPQLDGSRNWAIIRTEVIDSKVKITEYLERRARQDDDLWIVELDIPSAERFIGIQ